METNAIVPAAGDTAINNLKRIHPTANSGRRRQPPPRRKPRLKEDPGDEVTYTPDGQVATEDHGGQVDVSA